MTQGHMDRLTSFDTSFLANEKAERPHGDRRHHGLRGVGRPATRTSSPTSAAASTCCRACASASPSRRCSSGTPFWVDYPEFDIAPARPPRHPAGAGDRRPVPRAGRRAASRRRSIARSRSGSCGWSTASRTTASRSSTRPTTRWPTGSRRSTSACCSSTSSRKPRSPATEVPWKPAPAALDALGLPATGADRPRDAPSPRLVRWLAGAAADPEAGREAARSDGIVGLWEVSWNLTQAGAEGAVQHRDRPRPQLRLDDRAPRASSSRSRTPSAAPSTTSPWRSPPARCAAGSRTATSTSTGSS